MSGIDGTVTEGLNVCGPDIRHKLFFIILSIAHRWKKKTDCSYRLFRMAMHLSQSWREQSKASGSD